MQDSPAAALAIGFCPVTGLRSAAGVARDPDDLGACLVVDGAGSAEDEGAGEAEDSAGCEGDDVAGDSTTDDDGGVLDDGSLLA